MQSIKNFLKKNTKLAGFAAVSLLLGGLLYFTQEDEEQPKIQSKEQNLEENNQEISLQNQEDTTQITEQQLKKQKQDIAVLKKAMKEQIPLELEEGFLNEKTVKLIYLNIIIFSLRDIIKTRQEIVQARRRYFNDLPTYYKLIQAFYQTFLVYLSDGKQAVLALIEIDLAFFDKSRDFLEDKGVLKRNYLRDLTWHSIAEQLSQVTFEDLNLTKKRLVNYLNYQIEVIQEEYIKHEIFLQSLQREEKIILINARAEDQAFIKCQLEDYDYVKFLRYHINDQEILDLIQKRNRALELPEEKFEQPQNKQNQLQLKQEISQEKLEEQSQNTTQINNQDQTIQQIE